MSADQPLPQVTISRTESFSASHRLHSPYLTDEENKELYGKCNNFHGHGHNYKVDVMLKGTVDPVTGMVININDVKVAINNGIMDVLDHKNIDKDVPYFGSIPSTAENITIFIWNQMKLELAKIDKEHLLYENNLFCYGIKQIYKGSIVITSAFDSSSNHLQVIMNKRIISEGMEIEREKNEKQWSTIRHDGASVSEPGESKVLVMTMEPL